MSTELWQCAERGKKIVDDGWDYWYRQFKGFLFMASGIKNNTLCTIVLAFGIIIKPT
ncbi:hypothetical protein BDV26DRAFT_262648 [Aspergillus bertholletiae]|uniref:Uncharacterized protein n=1 Tax=Aspergillus bertholletiae TaxID=1226010 RepID=A0A5N7B820_9EURO|nr:hypothetical protein BDV26DRAFT_262648 [Aspergillus bertholletiae]